MEGAFSSYLKFVFVTRKICFYASPNMFTWYYYENKVFFETVTRLQ